MAKHPRKRQKLNDNRGDRKNKKSDKDPVQPLGSRVAVDDDAEKDDEERRLESMLFGTKFVPREAPGLDLIISDEDKSASDEEEGEDGHGQLQHLADSDLFYIDDGAPAPTHDLSSEASENEDQNDDDEEDHQLSDTRAEDDASASRSPSPSPQQSKRRTKSVAPTPSEAAKLKARGKRAAWSDPSDEPLTISLAKSHPRLRKLRDSLDEDIVTGKEYESRLRRQFERINPVPSWASKARKAARQWKDKDAIRGEESEAEADEEDLQDLLNTTSGILARGNRRTASGGIVLPPQQIAIERLRDANQSAQQTNCGQVKALSFHPSDKIPVLCVGTSDRRIRLFNVDGHTSPLLHTLHVPSLPITSQTSVQFHPSGSSILLAGPRPFFFTHDLQTGTTTHHARGLWGATYSMASDPTAALFSSSGRKRGRNTSSKSIFDHDEGTGKKGSTGNEKNRGVGEGMELAAFSPYPGDILAVAGRGGYIHLVDWKSGSGQVVTSLKCGGSGGAKGLWWVPPTQSLSALGSSSLVEPSSASSRPHLAVLSGDAEVYIWDVGQRRCVNRWKDEGGFRGAGRFMAGAIGHEGDGWLAVGSTSGFVNVYGADAFSPKPDTSQNPKVLKSIANLVTPISTLRFNHDAQLLAVASQEKKDAMRLIHLPSITSFANWPTSSTPLGHVTAIDFSARSEYLAIGNTRGRVLLYHLRDYGASGGNFSAI